MRKIDVSIDVELGSLFFLGGRWKAEGCDEEDEGDGKLKVVLDDHDLFDCFRFAKYLIVVGWRVGIL